MPTKSQEESISSLKLTVGRRQDIRARPQLNAVLGRPWRLIGEDMDSSAAVVDAIERAPSVVVPLVREVPSAFVKRRPKSGKWSVHEHACHLAVVHKLFFGRLDQMLTNPRPVITPYDPGSQDPDDALLKLELETSLASYVRDRVALVRRLRGLSDSDWTRTAEHGEYSHYSVFIMFRHLALHDFFHAYRIEELLLNREWADDWDRAVKAK